MDQPTDYTEPPGHAEIEIDIPDRSCFTCANQEPFGQARYVVWCLVHPGHVPVTCWCDQWRGSTTTMVS